MVNDRFDHPLKHSEEEGLGRNYDPNKSFDQTSGGDESVTIDYVSSEEKSEAGSSQEAEKQKTKSGKQPLALEIFKSKKLNFPPPGRGLNQFITAPVDDHSHQLFDDDDNNITFYRSKTENRASRYELKLNRLSEREKKKLIIELVKIQNDGTVEVDIDENAPVASELLELHSVEGASFYVNDSISCSKKSIPRLKIAMLVVGTRGDEFGHHVRLATHANFSSFVRSAGVDFYPLGDMARNKGFIPSAPGEISTQRKQLKAIIESLLAACTEPDMETGMPFKAQAIIANPPAYGHVHVAEALRIPIHIFFTMPWTKSMVSAHRGRGNAESAVEPIPVLEKEGLETDINQNGNLRKRPTYEFPHPLARVPQSAGYWLSYIVVDLLIWWGMRGYINEFRKRKLKLPPIAYFSTYHGSISHLPTGYMWSSHLVPKPSDWGPLVDVVGYCLLNLGSKYEPKEEFLQWIQKGTEPIYIGFGSMPLDDPKNTMDIILEALKDTGQRGIVDQGWGDLGNFMEVPDSVFLLKDCPHDWLFPQCAAVVHHGGAGTTAMGLRAGCPTTIVPFFGDQFFWGDRVHKKGLGPAPIPIARLSAESLSNAIRFMREPEVKSRAVELAKLIENEDGVGAAVDAFHRHLPPELPLPASSSEDNELPNPLQWFFIQIEKWCCLSCS
ncbi:sterol 3-beta-glucosyltransferase UGT80B1-like isoform X1 [Populus alba x Populus x berolinensis]|uniref:Sterol 3-beta-glucosyltransferase UGT80B1-like isoform X1 n=1 Tax=Populus alba x Populus x berolinensis TaxID=444605 RepID=A0AAD6QX84_9ROSI|nr:sterol 3-beta-glucosyltransferase UGT80B1-like isoform X1 [Populus alba x Populus x berolinensis]